MRLRTDRVGQFLKPSIEIDHYIFGKPITIKRCNAGNQIYVELTTLSAGARAPGPSVFSEAPTREGNTRA